MFSGIIKEIGIIKKIMRSPDGLHIGIKSKLKLLKSLNQKRSIFYLMRFNALQFNEI